LKNIINKGDKKQIQYVNKKKLWLNSNIKELDEANKRSETKKFFEEVK
jgi:hypothetical protein